MFLLKRFLMKFNTFIFFPCIAWAVLSAFDIGISNYMLRLQFEAPSFGICVYNGMCRYSDKITQIVMDRHIASCSHSLFSIIKKP